MSGKELGAGWLPFNKKNKRVERWLECPIDALRLLAPSPRGRALSFAPGSLLTTSPAAPVAVAPAVPSKPIPPSIPEIAFVVPFCFVHPSLSTDCLFSPFGAGSGITHPPKKHSTKNCYLRHFCNFSVQIWGRLKADCCVCVSRVICKSGVRCLPTVEPRPWTFNGPRKMDTATATDEGKPHGPNNWHPALLEITQMHSAHTLTHDKSESNPPPKPFQLKPPFAETCQFCAPPLSRLLATPSPIGPEKKSSSGSRWAIGVGGGS